MVMMIGLIFCYGKTTTQAGRKGVITGCRTDVVAYKYRSTGQEIVWSADG